MIYFIASLIWYGFIGWIGLVVVGLFIQGIRDMKQDKELLKDIADYCNKK